MKIRIFLATATAASVLMAAGAHAGNEAYLDQLGDDNSGLITQGGDGNRAGGPDGTLRILQRGTGHELTIDQVGDQNMVGTVSNGVNQGQSGNSSHSANKLTILQLTNLNHVNIVYQSDTKATAHITQGGGDGNVLTNLNQRGNGTAGNNHSATINQSGSGNWIGLWNQSSRTASPGTGVQQFDANNTIGIEQAGNYNRLQELVQRGSGNTANVTATGNLNVIHGIWQGHTDAFTSGGNTLTISLTGGENGSSGANASNSGWGPSYSALGFFAGGSAAAGVVVPTTSNGASVAGFQSSAQQYGAGNTLTYSVVGSRNQFGFLQGGDVNQINGIVSGSYNQIAIVQDGTGNIVDFAQTGDANDTGVEITGGGNRLDIRQNRSGAAGNRIGVRIAGNNNNSVGSPALSGDALAVRNVVRSAGLGAADFARGDLIQDGSNNKLQGDLLGTTPFTVTGDGNSFATFQSGNDNTIIGVINGGSNQAVVAQIGNNNVADMSQVGSGNNLGISQ